MCPYLEQDMPAHNRVVLSQGYSPRVCLRVFLPGVEVPRVRLAEQLYLQALRLRETGQDRPLAFRNHGLRETSKPAASVSWHSARRKRTLEYVVMTPPIFLPSIAPAARCQHNPMLLASFPFVRGGGGAAAPVAVAHRLGWILVE
jgi:hypothetical protein